MLKKHIFKIAKCIGLLLVCLLAGCTDSLIPYSTPTYNCFWGTYGEAQLVSAKLYLPGIDCEYPFDNNMLEWEFPEDISLYDYLSYLQGGIYQYMRDFEITWTTKVYEKKCDVSSDQSQQRKWWFANGIVYDDLHLNYNDIIVNSPLTDPYGSISYQDLEHELVIRLFNITNEDDGSVGTLTWTKNWIGYESSNYQNQDLPWEFYFPTDGVMGTFTPNEGYTRYIYVYNQFGYYN